jgi:hypothetical protein
MMTKKEFRELLEQKLAYFEARAIALEGAWEKLPDSAFANGYSLEMARLDKAMNRANAKVANAVMRANYRLDDRTIELCQQGWAEMDAAADAAFAHARAHQPRCGQ